MREKLIELLKLSPNCICDLCGERGRLDEVAEINADYLIANGVTIPVRCKDCGHGSNHCDKTGFCTYCNFGSVRGRYPVRMELDDFCSYGERKDNG